MSDIWVLWHELCNPQNVCARADMVTAMLREAWTPDAQRQRSDSTAAARQLYMLRLDPDAAAGVQGMNLLDVLRGKYRSRVPGFAGTLADAHRPYWAAWDPCSSARSRCAYRSALAAAPGYTSALHQGQVAHTFFDTW